MRREHAPGRLGSPHTGQTGAGEVLSLAGCRVRLLPRLVETTLPDGSVVSGSPHDTDAYRKTAAECGYGDDVERMNRTHEVAHSLLAAWLGRPCSHVFARVATGLHSHTALTRLEEAAVAAVERYAAALGVDLVERARDVGANTKWSNSC